MKRIFILSICLISFVIAKGQGTYTWTNAGLDNDFENPNNWTPAPFFNPFPSSGDIVMFDGTVTSDNCNMPNDNDLAAIGVLASYNGTIDASGIQLTITNMNLQGGTFLAPTGTFNIIAGSLTKAAGASFIATPTSVTNYTLNSTSLKTVTGNFNFGGLVIEGVGAGNRIINFASGTSSCTSLTLLDGGASFMSYRGSINVLDRLTISGTGLTAGPTNTGTFILSGATSKTITGTASALQNKIGNIRFNTSGTVLMTGNIAVAQSWSVANLGSFTAGSSTVSMLGGTITAGTTSTSQAFFDNLATVSGSTTIISGSSHVNLKADLIDNGTLTTNTSLIRMSGTGAQAVTGTSSITVINALEITNSGTKTMGHLVTILDSAKVSTGILASGGNLRLRSNSGMKARIAQIISGGSVSGNVVVETFLNGGTTGWANLCSPGVTGQTMANWNATIPMVCAACPFTTVGGNPFESVYTYNEQVPGVLASDAAHYVTISGLGQAINPTMGYWVYLGDNFPATGNITPVLTGPVSQNNSFGGISITNIDAVNSSEKGWNLIANPYPSPISLSSMFAGQTGNIDNTIQVWDTDLNGGAGDWAFYTLGGATNAIPMGQGFMVRSLGSTVNLTGSESWKTTSNSNVRKQTPFDYTKLFKLNLTGGGAMNFDTYTYLDVNGSYNLGFDNGKDVYAIDNGSGNMVAQIYSKINSDKYAIAAVPFPANHSNSIIPIHVATGYAGNYTITPYNNVELMGLCLELIDLENNNVHDLYFGAYTTTIAANNGSSPRFNLRVSDCGISDPVSIAEQNMNSSIYIGKDASEILVKLDFDQSTNTTISVTNILGQKIIENKNINALKETVSIDMPAKNQLIFVTVTTEKGRVTKKIIH